MSREAPKRTPLSDVLAKLAAGWPQHRLAELLPDRWTPASPAASP